MINHDWPFNEFICLDEALPVFKGYQLRYISPNPFALKRLYWLKNIYIYIKKIEIYKLNTFCLNEALMVKKKI